MTPPTRRVLLVVLDGFGIRAERDGNAIAIAGTPTLDALRERFPYSELGASGLDVGLPSGQMGNSEVGHTNLGAGRVVYQDLVKINLAVENGTLFANPVFKEAMAAARRPEKALHLLGLVSDGGVHSSLEHLLALVEMARREGVERLFVHAFTDGRDTPPKSAEAFVARVAERARVATVCGRFYAMDRDQRWERTEKAYRALVHGEGMRAAGALEAVKSAYTRGETDEFIQPTLVGDPAQGRIRSGDACIFFNFRPDRARQISRALATDGFAEFERGPSRPSPGAYATMTQYDKTFPFPVAYPPEQPVHICGEEIAARGWRQLRCAETEKYAHVTYFFNGGREHVYEREDRVLVPSPREVKTYDLKPEMSARGVTDAVLEGLADHEFVLVNYANPDMVGHTGVLEATVRAIRVVDECLGRLWAACEKEGRVFAVTADHGNAEMMIDPQTGQPHTAHTLNPVPLHVAHASLAGARMKDGILADVAPTLLRVMGVEVPKEMTGRSLLQ